MFLGQDSVGHLRLCVHDDRVGDLAQAPSCRDPLDLTNCARTVAARVAWERNCKLGEAVGYQIRFDDRLGDATRICFVTEGVLLRWLQDDPQLADVGAVLFDEFHERNLLSDVALALVKRLQQNARPDLRIVVMSATLEAEPVARYLGEAGEKVGKRESEKAPELSSSLSHSPTFSPAPILVSEGISFPVEVRYAEHLDRRPTTEQAADAVERIVNGANQTSAEIAALKAFSDAFTEGPQEASASMTRAILPGFFNSAAIGPR